jgi:hypothetical protein
MSRGRHGCECYDCGANRQQFVKLESHSKISSLFSNQPVMGLPRLLNLSEVHCRNQFRRLWGECANVAEFLLQDNNSKLAIAKGFNGIRRRLAPRFAAENRCSAPQTREPWHGQPAGR